ncbi:PhoPQ-activated protein PqaA family protein [Prosthecobacter sp.]|uniref:PhoPQ-activated protein PqaA family protein n=1 Tax=Prosthecobacter sp. TaxID=1965333 RepID=UPI002AB9B52B|nr:PhoPQ-activated protein PqaA family protein [Prosthecobacter sp.]MDZ4402731.1 PhoPQ-activated protein PqaA family protein [Prosthecobacter sp.]
MKLHAILAVVALSAMSAHSDITIGKFDMASVRDTSTLETKVIEDWHPNPKDAAIRQKLVEITVCEWWPGQKVRMPVTMLAPAKGVCTNVLIENTSAQLKVAATSGAKLRLLKEHGVGLVFIGCVPIDTMEPVGKLHTMMEARFIQTKDTRYTPAWIWGISDMRALTTAMAEKEVFQPKKVLATGGSKRGVATAAAGIADDRFTAIMPVVAPVIESPGGPYVEGMMPAEITKMNEAFIAAMADPVGRDKLLLRQKARSDERITVQMARDAGWSEAEMKTSCNAAWETCRTTNYLGVLKQRGTEIFYNQGSNDNVSPGLVELGRRFPQLPVYIVPGGQHGGAKEAGFVKSVGGLPEVDENLYAFATHHFFGARRLVAPPKVTTQWDKDKHRLAVTVTFPDGSEPQENSVWWSVNRHPDYSIAMEFDAWNSAPMQKTGPATYSGETKIDGDMRTLDVITVHAHAENGSTLTISSPELRLK